MKLVVLNCAALGASLIKRPDRGSGFHRIIEKGTFSELNTVFPDLTIPVQASITTGVYPGTHGILFNGLYEKDMQEVHFWHQNGKAVTAPRFWNELKKERKLKTAQLFWQVSKYVDLDVVISPTPVHLSDKVIPYVYTTPADYSAKLVEKFGQFPLHKYWGPFAGIESSQWIKNCLLDVINEFSPDLTFCYLPALDYNSQRHGPESDELLSDYDKLSELVSEIYDSLGSDTALVIISEYAMSEVKSAININRVLRKNDLLRVNRIEGHEFVELGDCRAFAIVDHQIAHIYLNGINHDKVCDILSADEDTKRCKFIYTSGQKDSYNINHERCGDIVLVAPEGVWFTYYWWFEDEYAPPFSRTVDIHAKPGFDPLELFVDKNGRIPFDTRLIKGSHGALHSKDKPVFISSIANISPPASVVDIPAFCREIINK